MPSYKFIQSRPGSSDPDLFRFIVDLELAFGNATNALHVIATSAQAFFYRIRQESERQNATPISNQYLFIYFFKLISFTAQQHTLSFLGM